MGIGRPIRVVRKRMGVSAIVTAEAAGMSRVTLHRIEKGEPSVTMGAYMAALTALGLDLGLVEFQQPETYVPIPDMIRLSDFPELKRLAWHMPGAEEVSPLEALEMYERNWKHVDEESMTERERALIASIVHHFGGGRLLV